VQPYRTPKDAWKERLRPELDARGFRCAGTLAVRRSPSGRLAVLIEQTGSRFNVGPGHGVPATYQLDAWVLAAVEPLPKLGQKIRLARAHPVFRADPRGMYATGPFERLAAAGFPPPVGTLGEDDAVALLAAVATDTDDLDADDVFVRAPAALSPVPLGQLAFAAELGRIEVCRELVARFGIGGDHRDFVLKPYGVVLG
jgi:hypothetical protein